MKNMTSKTIEYENGLRLVAENLPHVHSVAMGIYIKAGAAYEDAGNNGISHFLEHMLFKGTNKLNAFEIAQKFESMGASINAFTSSDCTCYHSKSIADKAEECFELWSHLLFDSIFPENELEREKGVVIEEIGMQVDDPDSVCYNILAEALYDGTLSQTILGPAANIQKFTKADLVKYMADYYHAKRIVISFSGKITLTDADRLVRKYFLDRVKPEKGKQRNIENKFLSKQSVVTDDYEQSNLIIAFPSIKLNHELSPVQTILSMILGMGMSSRLFQTIREKEGLAYMVYSNPSVYVSAGSFNIHVNYSAQNTGKVIELIKKEIQLLLEGGVNDGELNRAIAQAKTALVFAQENVHSQMLAFGKLLLLCDEVYDMEKRLKAFDSVTKEAVLNFASDLFKRSPALAYLGKEPDVKPKW